MSSSAITFESPPNSPPPPPLAAATAKPPATGGTPKFKSSPPPSLPISTPAFSPSSYFSISGGLTASDFLDSPVLLSSSQILASPTTGSFPLHAFNWNTNNQDQQQHNNFTDFSFQNQSNHSTEIYHQPKTEDDKDFMTSEYPFQMQSFSPEISTIQTNSNLHDRNDYNHRTSQKKLDDGYNWRKYGQKQVKGSENPRSYYKCTYRNCSMRKKVETTADGDITEIVYKGNHDHPKPQSSKRSSDSSNPLVVSQFNDCPDQFRGCGQLDLVGTPENSSNSIGDDEFSGSRSRSGGDEFLEDEARAKRSKMNNEDELISMEGSRTVREPRVVVQTISDIDILDDGYRWRKYGQKVVKGNPNPRSYYKCTTLGCSVRKHVERASHDLRSVITTYEGKHTHDVPLARGAGHRPLPPSKPGNSVATMTMKPSELSHRRPSNTMINTVHESKLPSSTETPFTLEMLHNPSGFTFSGFDNPIRAGYMDRQANLDNVFSIAKDEPKDDNFLESLLY